MLDRFLRVMLSVLMITVIAAALFSIADAARHLATDRQQLAAPCVPVGAAERREPERRETRDRERRRELLTERIRRNAGELADRVDAASAIHGGSLAPKSTHAPAR